MMGLLDVRTRANAPNPIHIVYTLYQDGVCCFHATQILSLP